MNSHTYQQQQQQQSQSTSLGRTQSNSYTPTSQHSANNDNTVSAIGSGSNIGVANINNSSKNIPNFTWVKNFGESKGSATSNNGNGEIWGSSAMGTAVSMNDNLLQSRLQSFSFAQPGSNIGNTNLYSGSIQDSITDSGSNNFSSSTLVNNSVNALAMKLSDFNTSQRYTSSQIQPNMFAGSSRQGHISQPQSPLEEYSTTLGYTERSVDTSASGNSNLVGLNYYANRKSLSGLESSAATTQTKGSVFDTHDLTNDTSTTSSNKLLGSSSANNVNGSNVDELKFQLQLKDSVIKNLEETNESLLSKIKAKIGDPSNSSNNSNFEVPNNHEKLYNQLANKLMATQNELEDTKTRLESIMTAIYLNPSHTATKTGRYDEEEIAHKIITKMQMLTEENEQMARMLSYGKSKEKDITIGLLKKQNIELKEKATKLETKLHDLKNNSSNNSTTANTNNITNN